MNVYLQECTFVRDRYNASSKARVDCDNILRRMGYRPRIMRVSESHFLYNLLRFYNVLMLPFRLIKAKRVLLQYPYYSYVRLGKYFYKYMFCMYSGKIECLIHDIIWYRDGKGIEPTLGYLLSLCDSIIVHTPKMKDLLVEQFSISPHKIQILYLFDYLSDVKPIQLKTIDNTIIFAGNLSKSLFLSRLNELPNTLKFHIYGAYSENVKETDNCVYKGKFSPDDIAAIEGSWGLVWDGDQLETCHGGMGEYLRINSSHKISLYIAACKPVIIWAESSLSEFIETNKLGISVSSLFDIEERITNLTEDEKIDIMNNVYQYSCKLRKGEMLFNCMSETNQ